MDWFVIVAACAFCGACAGWCLFQARAARRESQMAAFLCVRAGESASTAQTAAKRIMQPVLSWPTGQNAAVLTNLLNEDKGGVIVSPVFVTDPTLPAGVPFAFDPSQVQPESQA